MRSKPISVHLPGARQVLVASLLAAFAQVGQAGPLDDFARNNGGTETQIAIAEAIQSICPRLIASFGGLDNVLEAPETPDKDITLRCNELVLTSVDQTDPSAEPARSLQYTENNDLLAALQEVTGEELNSQSTMTVRTANGQAANIASRLAAIRLGTLGGGSVAASNFNFDVNGMQMASSDAGDARPLGGAASGDGEFPALGWFANGSYNTGERDETDLEDGFDFDAFNITVGIDYRIGDNAVIGAAFGYDDFEADFDESAVVSGGDIASDGYTASLFGLMEFGNFYVDGIAMAGQMDYEMSRVLQYESNNTDPNCQCPSQDRNLQSDTDGDHYTVAVNAGWSNYMDAWLLQVSGGVSYRNYEIDGYTEFDTASSGGMELRFGDQEVESLRSVLGFRISRAFNQDYGVLHPTFSADWYHEFEDDGEEVSAKYAQEDLLAQSNPELGFTTSLSDCLSCFTIRAEDPDSDYGVIGAGVALVLPNFLQFLVNVEGLVGYEDLTSYAVTFGVRGQF